ncbi:MAG: tetratricopeptide repeat protein [Armatimonadota bacterium]
MGTHRIHGHVALAALAIVAVILPASSLAEQALPRIAFAAASDTSGANAAGLDIYLLQPDGVTVQLTRALGADRFPAWSPDGKHIAFVSERDGSPQVYVMMADGSSQRRLTQDSLAECGWPAWSHDGKRIAFEAREQPGGKFGVYLMSKDGQQARRISGGGSDARRPAWRPDGKLLALSVRRQDGWYLCTVQPDGSNLQPILQEAVSSDHVPDPAWSPDGSKIAFSSDRGGAGKDIYVVNADGSGLARLTQSGGPNEHPVWSVDGAQILFVSERGGRRGLFAMAADGSSPTPISTGDVADACDGAWHPQDKGHLTLAQAPAEAAAASSTPPSREEFDAELKQGSAALQQNNFAEAIRHFERARELDPASPQPDWWLGRAYTYQVPPDSQKALDSFAAAVAKDAKRQELGGSQKGLAYGVIGAAYLGSAASDPKRLDDAVKMLMLATTADQNEPRWPYALARALARKGDAQRAIGALRLVNTIEERTGRRGTLAKAVNEADFAALRQIPEFATLIANAASSAAAGASPPPPSPAPTAPSPTPAPTSAAQGAARLLAWTSYRDANPEVYVMDLHRMRPINLTRNPATDEQPAISPDLTKIAFVSDRDGNKEIYVIGLDGKNLKRLTNSPGDDVQPRWTPDGKKIIFCSQRGGNKDIWIMDADGGYPNRVAPDAGIDEYPDVR